MTIIVQKVIYSNYTSVVPRTEKNIGLELTRIALLFQLISSVMSISVPRKYLYLCAMKTRLRAVDQFQ